jgi:choline-sulfatase
MAPVSLRILAACLAVSLASTACRPATVRTRAGLNLLFVTIDTLRADRLGAYGYASARTPHLDELARRGLLFEEVTSQVPVTLPSHASLFTGLVPPIHGVRDNTYFRLDSRAETLAEQLASHGYDTAAFVGAFVLDHSFGLDQGFASYDDDLTEGAGSAGTIAERKGELVERSFESWLEKRANDEPFFAWLHFFDPHLPYAPPAPYPADYDGEIAYVDAQIGAVLEALERKVNRDRTLVVVTSDHGESLGEHGEKSHGFFVYDSTLRVPLILASDGQLPAGKRISSPVRSIDVLPTVLEMLELPPPTGIQGRSLLPLVRGDAPSTKAPPAYAECYVPELNFHWAPLVALREEGYKYIEAPRAELYDLTNDPGETENLVAREPERAGRMRARLAELLTSWPDSLSARLQPDPETLARLRSLGYTASGGGDVGPALEAEARALPDPKDRLHLWTRLEEVILAQASGDDVKAASEARAVLSEDPTNLLALELLAGIDSRAGDRSGAIDLYRKILSIDDSRPLSHLSYGNLLWEAGDVAGAEASFRASLERDARFTKAAMRLGELYLSLGRTDDALASFSEAAKGNESDPGARLGMARALRASGKGAEAEKLLDELHRQAPANPEVLAEYAGTLAQRGEIQGAIDLLEKGPDHHDVHYTLSILYRARGDMERALAELQKAIALEPRSAVALHDRGVLLSRLGRLEEARVTLEKALEVGDRPQTQNALGTTLCRMERCPEAIPHFEKAVASAPEFIEALENLAQAYWIVGRSDDAKRTERRVEALKSRR